MIKLLISTAAGIYRMGVVLHPWCYLVCVGHSRCLRFYHFTYFVLTYIFNFVLATKANQLEYIVVVVNKRFSDGFGDWLKASHYTVGTISPDQDLCTDGQ